MIVLNRHPAAQQSNEALATLAEILAALQPISSIFARRLQKAVPLFHWMNFLRFLPLM
jgi:hypothetical protein